MKMGLEMDLRLFDGDGAGAGEGAQAQGAQDSAAAEAESGAEGKTGDAQPQDPKAREKQYRDLMNEYRDLYQADVQRQVKSRLRGKQALEQQLNKYQGVIELAAERYQVNDGNVDQLLEKMRGDNSYCQKMADEMGITLEAAKRFKEQEYRLKAAERSQRQLEQERENREKVTRWVSEAGEAKERYPGLDLNLELEDPNFVAMLERGVPVESAYIAMHADEVMGGAMEYTYQKAREKTVQDIRARGMRPVENGVKAGTAVAQKLDPARMTRKEREELEKRALRGELIEF